MNFRATTLLFGIFLGVLWVFGLMLALGRSTFDLGFVMPEFAQTSSKDIDFVDIASSGKNYLFNRTKDGWRLQIPPQKQELRVVDGDVDNLIDEIRTARHSNDDTEINNNLQDPRWKLLDPRIVVTLKTAKGKEWVFKVGGESADAAFAYVTSSDRPKDVMAVKRSSIAKLFFTDINSFRYRKLLEAKEVDVRRIELKETRDKKVTELALEKVKDKPWWRLTKPALGAADYEGSPSKPDQSVRALISNVIKLRADDFEPLDTAVTVTEKDALLRIELAAETEDPNKEPGKVPAKEGKDQPLKTEVLLIGAPCPMPSGGADKKQEPTQYYARLASDSTIVRVSFNDLKPVFALISDPKLLRSHDVAQFEPALVEAVDLSAFKGGKEEVKLVKDKLAWFVYPPGDKKKLANLPAVTGPSGLLSAIQGKFEINDKDFAETDDTGKLKDKDLEARFAKDLLARVVVWGADSLEPAAAKKAAKIEEKPAENKGDKKPTEKEAAAKKDDKKSPDKDAAAKKDDQTNKKTPDKDAAAKKDDQTNKKTPDKDAAAKKDDKIDENSPPLPKSGAKPLVTLSFISGDKGKVMVKRETPDGDLPVYFQLPDSDYEKIAPADMVVAFFDTSIKTFDFGDVTKLELTRSSGKEKNPETFQLVKLPKEKEDKDKKATEKKDDKKPAEKDAAATKDDKKNPDKGKDAVAKKEWKLVEPKEFASKDVEVGQINQLLDSLFSLHAIRWVKKVSKESLSHYGLDDKNVAVRVAVTTKPSESVIRDRLVGLLGSMPGTAPLLGSYAVFASAFDAKPFVLRLGESSAKETDQGGVYAYVEGTAYVFLVDSKIDKLLKEAEFRDRHALTFDAAKVKEFRVFIMTADKEPRNIVFERDADKVWKDVKERLGFRIDSKKVEELLGRLADLQVVRYLNVKGTPSKDYELGEIAPLKFEVAMDDGKTVHKVQVGAASEKSGPYYGQCTGVDGVFLLGRDPFAELMGKVTYFRKD